MKGSTFGTGLTTNIFMAVRREIIRCGTARYSTILNSKCRGFCCRTFDSGFKSITLTATDLMQSLRYSMSTTATTIALAATITSILTTCSTPTPSPISPSPINSPKSFILKYYSSLKTLAAFPDYAAPFKREESALVFGWRWPFPTCGSG